MVCGTKNLSEHCRIERNQKGKLSQSSNFYILKTTTSKIKKKMKLVNLKTNKPKIAGTTKSLFG